MIRTRFAPSPTGFLHIGGARTALFSWLFARHYQGRFILRIEDTDKARSTPEAIQAILDGMAWLNLNYDEGPYFQTQRSERYQSILNQLFSTGHAYRCVCTLTRLEALRNEQIANKQKPRYDGRCRNLEIPDTNQPFVVRFRNPQDGTILVQDQLHGAVSFKNSELDDLILARSDGSPTYNFTVVVDDYDMEITHIIRGDDHLNNTPRQINLLKALKAPIPIYIHLPMIRGTDGKKLSKRAGALNVTYYRSEGYLPEAMINYLARLGWSHGDQEIFSQAALIQYFDGTHLNKAPAILNPSKLLWLNQHYLKHSDPNHLAVHLKPFMDLPSSSKFRETISLSDIASAQQGRVKTLKEMAEKSAFVYQPPVLDTSYSIPENLREALQALDKQLLQLNEWHTEKINELLQRLMCDYTVPQSQLFQILRHILTGDKTSPPIHVTMQLLGKHQVSARLHQAITI